jgi:8-hydroxy-5-deazaflavin:NADPH oxidoreductase
MSKKVGIIGSGSVGVTLANGLILHGYDVMIGTGKPEKHDDLKAKTGGRASVGSFADAAAFGDIAILCVTGYAAESTVQALDPAILAGKTVIDTNNPFANAAPVNGVQPFFTSMNESLLERLQALAPEAHFVKAFNCVGAVHMVNPDFGGVKPTMFICGNVPSAKSDATEILDAFGWEVEDLGAIEAARAIEPLCMLWCIPGFRSNSWMHAFKLLKK